MLNFKSFLKEEKKPTAGIAHIEHPSDRSFDGADAAQHALSTLRGVSAGTVPITRKIDDKMSFHAIRRDDGSVGVKYKGSGSHYNFSEKDVDEQHGHKPYLAGPLKGLLNHIGKVLPKEPGEYQGGYMSEPHTREMKSGQVSHTPNTIEYRTPATSAEGKKLRQSKVSAVIHTKLVGADKSPQPITSMDGFDSHPDFHQVSHVVSAEHRKVNPAHKKKADAHIDAAEELMKDHDYSHLDGHEIHLRTYINRNVSSGDTPTVEGYKKHLYDALNKKVDAVKTDAAKQRHAATRDASVAHVEKNKAAFDKSLKIHQNLQQATNILARSLDDHGAGGFTTHINDNPAGGEGYVANGIKIVDREGFSKANRERSEILRANRGKK